MEYYLLAILLNTIVLMICGIIIVQRENKVIVQCKCDRKVDIIPEIPTIDPDKLSPDELKENEFYR